MRRFSKKFGAVLCASAMAVSTLAGAVGAFASEETTEEAASGEKSKGIDEESPYYDFGLDLSEEKNVVMYALGDRPTDMDKVLDYLNETYLLPYLNTTLSMEFLNWSDYQDKYSLVLAGGETVDLMYTSSWCYYSDEAGKGAFRELDTDWLKKYMPISYEQQPAESWDQISIDGKIFAVPKSNASFNGYNFMIVRKDLMDKYGIESINSMDELKDYLSKVAADTDETGIYASGQTSNRDEFINLFWQNIGAIELASGHDYMYYHHDSEAAPDFDKDVFYKYTSDEYLQYCLQAAEMAEEGIWSSDAINDSNEARGYFENGTSGSFSWNETIYDAGKALEEAGLGEYAAFDVTPEVSRKRGSYADDAIAITTSSKDPERAALVLDCLKGFSEINSTILGGIEGEHWTLNDDGTRSLTDDSANYSWNSWAWGLQRQDQPLEAGLDPRKEEFKTICEEHEFVPTIAGFTFDKTPVETELAVVNAIRDEYLKSFYLGIYGDDTESTFNDFKAQLEAAGLDKITEEIKRQYEAYCEEKGL